MQVKEFITYVHALKNSELIPDDQALIEEAKQAALRAYAPYSNFSVGAAVRLANGVTVQGSNQENASSPLGMCAERVAIFHANALYPDQAVTALAIAARNAEGYLGTPVFPCGGCRQVLVEAEQRYHTPIRLLLYGTLCSYEINQSGDLLPFAFRKSSMNG